MADEHPASTPEEPGVGTFGERAEDPADDMQELRDQLNSTAPVGCHYIIGNTVVYSPNDPVGNCPGCGTPYSDMGGCVPENTIPETRAWCAQMKSYYYEDGSLVE